MKYYQNKACKISLLAYECTTFDFSFIICVNDFIRIWNLKKILWFSLWFDDFDDRLRLYYFGFNIVNELICECKRKDWIVYDLR
jgi:hypothetical protein